MTKTNHPFIVVDSNIRGKHPIITGTGIRVLDIAIEYEYKGYSVDHIIDYHPHLELKHIHDALSYYYENQAEFDQQIKDDKKRADEMKRKLSQGSIKLESGYA